MLYLVFYLLRKMIHYYISVLITSRISSKCEDEIIIKCRLGTLFGLSNRHLSKSDSLQLMFVEVFWGSREKLLMLIGLNKVIKLSLKGLDSIKPQSQHNHRQIVYEWRKVKVILTLCRSGRGTDNTPSAHKGSMGNFQVTKSLSHIAWC